MSVYAAGNEPAQHTKYLSLTILSHFLDIGWIGSFCSKKFASNLEIHKKLVTLEILKAAHKNESQKMCLNDWDFNGKLLISLLYRC